MFEGIADSPTAAQPRKLLDGPATDSDAYHWLGAPRPDGGAVNRAREPED